MALEGTLRDFSLSDIFQLISLQRKTGILTLSSKEDTVTVSFLDGKVVNADSKKRGLENRLGKVLIKRGNVSEERLQEALKLQQETLQRLGYLLIKEGIITKDELREALTQQILEIIYKVFRWRDGEYHFSQETTIEFDRDAIIPLTAESILMEGAQMMDEWPIVERKITSPRIIFQKVEMSQPVEEASAEEEGNFDFDFSDEPEEEKVVESDVIQLPPQVYSVYSLVDGRMTVADIVERSRLNEFETYKALFELVTRNIIQEMETTEEVEEEVEEEVPEEEVIEEKRAFFLPLVLAVFLVVVGIFFRPFNPMNSWKSLISSADMLDECLYSASLSRIIHLERAMSIYAVAYMKYPKNLDNFIQSKLIDPNMLIDPWGNAYTYLHEANNYYLYGYQPDGTKSLELMTSHPEIGGEATDEDVIEEQPKVVILE